jgi:hypothetical protein
MAAAGYGAKNQDWGQACDFCDLEFDCMGCGACFRGGNDWESQKSQAWPRFVFCDPDLYFDTLHYYDKTDSDKPRALRMAGATWNALNDYAKAKKCGCHGKFDPSWWQQVIDFSRYEGANFDALETIDSNGEILNFGMTNNPQYLLRKIRILGLGLR